MYLDAFSCAPQPYCGQHQQLVPASSFPLLGLTLRRPLLGVPGGLVLRKVV